MFELFLYLSLIFYLYLNLNNFLSLIISMEYFSCFVMVLDVLIFNKNYSRFIGNLTCI